MRCKTLMILVAVILGSVSLEADIQWSRLNGRVKGINGKTQQVTIQNREGDLLTVKIDPDVLIVRDKQEIHLKDVSMDEKVTLLYIPKAPEPKDTEEPPEGGVYKPIPR